MFIFFLIYTFQSIFNRKNFLLAQTRKQQQIRETTAIIYQVYHRKGNPSFANLQRRPSDNDKMKIKLVYFMYTFYN